MNKKKKRYRQKLKHRAWVFHGVDFETQVLLAWALSKKDYTYNEYKEHYMKVKGIEK